MDIDISEAILSEAMIGSDGQKTGERTDDGKYEVVRSRFEFWNILKEECEPSDDGTNEPKIDSDGDFEVRRRPRCRDYLFIDHTMATTLADVGLQVWHGALLLCDYLLFRSGDISEKYVLDLGCGTGLTSICAAIAGARMVYATDSSQESLQLTHRNVLLNSHLIPGRGRSVKTRKLDWRFPLPKSTQEWSEADREDFQHCSIFLAADVIYDPNLNEALFSTIEQLSNKDRHQDITVLISVEKRYNFTLSHMTVACPAYDHFSAWMEELQLKGWTCEKIDTAEVPICFMYQRNNDMEIWRLVRNGNTQTAS